MSFSDPTIDRIEASFKELVQDINLTSGATRTGWIFFLALQAYVVLALAGVNHRDLLLDSPVTLPLLQVQIPLKSFFLFTPAIFVLIHLGILIQHVMLARQCLELHRRVATFEGTGLFRAHRVRMHLHSYAFTQLIAGPQRGGLLSFFLSLLTWLSLGILPVLLLLGFQTAYLPNHDLEATWAHRVYLVLDIILLAIFAVFMRYPTLGFVGGFGRTIVDRPFSFLISFIFGVAAMFFSLSVATIPDEQMDRVMTALMPANLPGENAGGGQPRQAFLPTAVVFEGFVDPLSGRPAGFFSRNLVVTDADLIGDAALDSAKASINLRRRDLRYATLDRSDMRQADLTGALLNRASLREVNLAGARAEKAVFRGADLWRAQFIPASGGEPPVSGINLRGADLRNANLVEANLQGAELQGALLEAADLRGAQMDVEDVAEATRQGAKF